MQLQDDVFLTSSLTTQPHTMGVQNVFLLCLLLVCTCYGERSGILNLEDKSLYRDCDDVLRGGHYKESGNYIVSLNKSEPLEVYCHFESLNASRTVIMQQKYGRLSFARGWSDYENGFGSVYTGDYWLGLRGMQALTASGQRVLTVTLQDWSNTIKVLRYSYFFLDPASHRYRLHIGGYQSHHVLIDDFSHNDGMQFSTIDRPDIHHCASQQKAGWWYNYCTYTLPTGHYYYGGHYKPSGSFYDGIYYKDWHNFGYSLKYIKMELSSY